MSNIIIREAKLEDAKDKGYVHYKSWQETYAGIINQEYLDKMSIEKCVAIAEKYPENTLIAEFDGKVTGFLCYSQCRDMDYEDCAEIVAVYVLKEYHKKGIGKMLMDEAIKKLSEYKKLILWVLDNNKNAIGFYEKYGFSLDGTKKEAVLVTPVTELRMIKDIYKRK